MLFDLHQRYRFIAHLIADLSGGKRSVILEIGAAGSPLRGMMAEHQFVMVDSTRNEQNIDIQADGLHLPFGDCTFDLVVCSDALEHVESSSRTSFLSEVMRVTARALILGFPHLDPENLKADEVFLRFIQQYDNKDFRHLEEYLKEHQKQGLPESSEVRKHLENVAGEVLQFKNSNLYSWMLFQLGHFSLLQQSRFEPVRRLFNEYFVEQLEPFSHASPCYRTIFVASKNALEEETKQRLCARIIPENTNIAVEHAARAVEFVGTFERIVQENTQELSALKEEKERLEKVVDEQSRVIDNLQQYLNVFLQHPVYQLYRSARSRFDRLFHLVKPGLADADYLLYQKTFEPDADECKVQSEAWQNWPRKPSFSIVTAVFDPAPEIFQETIDSVLQQSYGNWTWNVVDAGKNETIWNKLVALASADLRVKPERLPENRGISNNFNVAIQKADGDYIVMLDHDDTLAPNALYAVADAIRNRPELDFLYSDSDKIDESGRRCNPLFKPDWSPELMLCCNLLNQISVFRRSLLEQTGFFCPELDGAQDWDLYFKIIERTDRIHHIPQILYHWRKTAYSTASSGHTKPYAKKAQIQAITNHLQRTGIPHPEVVFHPLHPVHKTYPVSRWRQSRSHIVSIIIPTKDRAGLLRKCIDSVKTSTTYNHYEIVLVDTGSTEPSTHAYYEQLQKDRSVSLVRFQEPFNFGKACNTGAANANGDMYLFLNNDTEVLVPEWLELMLQWFERPGVGIVGGKLLYPNGRLQHAGVILGMGGLAGHLFAGEKENTFGLFGTDGWYRNLSAVTAACLMVPRQLFSEIGGFDESFHLVYSDVELCLRAIERGYRIVYSPEVRLLHHESASHNRNIPRIDFENATQKWRNHLAKGDPYYNRNLTCTRARPVFRQGTETALQLNQQLMQRLPQKEIILLPGDVL